MTRNPFHTVAPQRERLIAMENIKRGQRALESRMRELEKEKKEVSKEVQAVEKSIHEQLSRKAVSLSMFCGFNLSEYDIKEEQDNSKVLSATCKDNSYPFKVFVTIQGELIQAVNISMPNHSRLAEVGKLLDSLSELCSPSLVLMTIQQFIHRNKFREKVLQKLQSSGNRNIKVYSRQDLKAHGKDQAHTIHLYNSNRHHSSEIAAEILWSIMWDPARQALVHYLSAPVTEGATLSVRKKLIDLHSSSALMNCEETLWNWWEDLLLNIIKA